MTNYELVRNKVIEAVPEIMELKFGCRIGTIQNLNFTIVSGPASKHPYKDSYWASRNPEEISHGGYIVKKDDISEIIGREIRLSDVLRAIANAEFLVKDGNFITWCFRKPNMQDHGEVEIWDLTHDSLEWHRDNKSEVVDFLAEILK